MKFSNSFLTSHAFPLSPASLHLGNEHHLVPTLKKSTTEQGHNI